MGFLRGHWKLPGAAWAGAWLLASGGVAAGESAEAPPVPLEKLLRLPPGVEVEAPRYGGLTRREWRSRFGEVRAERARAEAALAAAQTELEGIAAETDQWQLAAPGLGNIQTTGEAAPLSYKLHQEIRRQRESIEDANRRLQELRVEANLAGVPAEWIEPAAKAPAPVTAEATEAP